jgi:hypothetical protein
MRGVRALAPEYDIKILAQTGESLTTQEPFELAERSWAHFRRERVVPSRTSETPNRARPAARNLRPADVISAARRSLFSGLNVAQ